MPLLQPILSPIGKKPYRLTRVNIRDATGLNLSSFELIELLIFGLGPSPSLGPILIVELWLSSFEP